MSSSPPGWPDGVGRRILAEVDSTNAEAARLAQDAVGRTWILAHRQLQGRGRRGRPWADPEGNFAATLLIRPAPPPVEGALRSFAAALALADALDAVAGVADRIALKWPNDVLLDGRKLAGILLEAGGPPRDPHLCVGIGVNLQAAPEAAGLDAGAVPPVSLRAATGVSVAPETLLDHLAPTFARWEHDLATYGFAPLRNAFLARAARRGQTLTARTPRSEITGRFETIDAAGALVLATPSGRVSVAAADIYFDEREPGHAAGD